MKTVFYIIGFALSILGFIAGIILGVTTENFGYCVLEWIGVFLYAVIYFGIATILDNQEDIMGKLYLLSNTKTYNPTSTPVNSNVNSGSFNFANNTKSQTNTTSANEWVCPQCGKTNKGFIEFCFDCGTKKP